MTPFFSVGQLRKIFSRDIKCFWLQKMFLRRLLLSKEATKKVWGPKSEKMLSFVLNQS